MEICDSDRLARQRIIRNRKVSGRFCLVFIGCALVVASVIAWFLDPHLFAGGTCPFSYDTGTSCYFFHCGDDHGPTHCVNYRCVCRTGFCSDDGFCILNTTGLTARVVPVDSDRPVFPGPHGHVKTALCMSGGGARSLSIVAGSLRALEHLELMEHVDAISAVSGGAWAAAIYMFAKSSKTDLLGNIQKPTDPSLLTMDVLDSKPPQLGAAVTQSMWEFLSQFRFHGRKETTWIRFVAFSILKQFNLHQLDYFLAANESDVEQIRSVNPIMASQPFHIVQPNRPKVLVFGGTVLSGRGTSVDSDRVVTLQMSPDFVGIPFHPFGGEVGGDEIIGGGFVETFAFGGSEPRSGGQDGGDAVVVGPPRDPFSLADAVGISSCAPAPELAKLAHVVNLAPEALLWPVTPIEHQPAETVLLGDGGNMENAGLLAMLQRKSSRIAWLINTDVPLDGDIDFCKIVFERGGWDPNGHVTNQLTDKFGFPAESKVSILTHNQVFAENDFGDVLCGLQNQTTAGRPAVYKTNLGVLPNHYWGIEGNFDVDIIFVYNEVADDFIKQLPSDTQAALQQDSSEPFKNFPWFKTTFQNKGELVKLTNRQVNLLAAHAEFAVMENKDTFAELFRPG
eukprot:TRINITY_DN12095_c0_g2_i2.p1 TRINITY_DN12095_c0_g2~~TRINITY_DN12095_c0_g2_i2.p1  ORF type:complete len:621 (+),score=96.56 TRINITY_DN12095_c0_g2_i2:133-1995(+)